MLALLLAAPLALAPFDDAAGASSPPQTGPPRAVIAGDYEKKTLARVNADGTTAWSKPIRAIHDLHALPNGHTLYQTNFRNVIEADADGNTVWRYDAPEGVEIHAFQCLPDGATLIAESGKRRLIEVTPDGSIRAEVPLTVDRPDKHRDTRLARKTPAGTYLVAHENDAAVREYDADGTVVWSFDVGSKVYGVERLANGNTLLGTGDGHRVIEVNPAKEIVWELTSDDLPGVELVWVTMATRQPNGNTVVVNCHAGPENPQILEVTPEKQLVWSFKDFARFGNALPVAVLPGE
ncbi:beta-propeller domain-containing protein [Alienimonas californiensis]|uniref:Pyrrolo-quinoline quinone repeat domain-containing protein n=1 Tax=Alienimonas californiensis TaxID=2527989 RepID=A0A517P866_9PLAN|nr:PQQ-binding-like beta-propeller repeat protein [Alienimonas californiensis]QDT15564.1 hypothetical protein CA12_16490 [Alienimonas californiensis]